MKPEKDAILAKILGLPEHERLEVADRLYESVYGARDASVDEAWSNEIARRMSEIDSGRARLVPWDQVRAELLSKGRARAAG